MRATLYILLLLLLCGCSTKKNNVFTRNYHQLTTRYNVYFNGNEAFKSGLKKMNLKHKEDYTNLLPVFVSNNEQTRTASSSDMDYAIEKAAKAIDKHSITVKPRRKKNKDSKNYETFRKKKEFNNQINKCYLLLGKSYFYKKKFTMANNTFRFILRQNPEDEKLLTEVKLWLFRSITEMGRGDEAAKLMNELAGAKLNKKQREMYAAAKTDFQIRQGNYPAAISEGEQLVSTTKNLKRRPRYYFLLSQLYLKENQDAAAMAALKKTVKFNFNYEMVFNAKINMALAYREGDDGVVKKLNKMLKDSKNEEYRDRIYYALANIEEKRGDQPAAIDLYWKSVKASVDNDNQKSLSFFKLGEYYFAGRDYPIAQSCYDSCMYFMDSRFEDYDKLKVLVTDLTELVTNLNVIQKQDSLQRLAALPEAERNKLIDTEIAKIKEEEDKAKALVQEAQKERSFYQRNDMVSRGDAFSQGNGGEWYFYNPVTISLGKNDFKRKWGRRKLEDNWRRQNKSMVDFGTEEEVIAENGDQKEKLDVKSRDYYLQEVPLTDEKKAVSEKMVEEAYYKAGEIYLYKFNDYPKALDCFEKFIARFTESNNLSQVYYLAYSTADKNGESAKAEKYKEELIRKFPESDFAKGLLDPNYFKKVDNELKIINQQYQQAYAKYEEVYYDEALAMCDDILRKYPDNKLKVHVLFLKAMCVVNLHQEEEARTALNAVLAAKPDKEMREVAAAILASLDVGDKPVRYTATEMADARTLKASRNWVFDGEGKAEEEAELKENPFKVEKEGEFYVLLLLPENFKTLKNLQIQGRLGFINAAEAVEGNKYEAKKEELWYKKTATLIKTFTGLEQASAYLKRVGSDKVLLKNIGQESYRIFAITPANLSMLKRLKDVDAYVKFFVENYFVDRNQGGIITGMQGTAAHMFHYEDNEKHDFMMLLPFRKVNVKKIAEALLQLEHAFAIEKEDYDNENELLVVRSVGNKTQAVDYMNLVLKDKTIFDYLAGVEHQDFVITQNNLKTLLENHEIENYMKFFNDNYLTSLSGAEGGIADGEFVYNKEINHKFVLFYSNKVDPFKLKAVFEEFNFAGLKMNNSKYDDENDCLIISGFGNKDEAMRYFDNVVGNRKLFKPLKNTDYRNFIISDWNFGILQEKKQMEEYLLFFKKYYMK